MRQQFVRDGRVISYLEAVRPGPARPKTLVLLHAFPLAAEMWQPQLAAVPVGWRFLAPDLCGFGASALETAATADTDAAAVSIDDYAHDVVALLDELDVERAVIGGLSMGGYVAFALWRLARGRVGGLVLADTKAEADSDSARAARDSMLATLAQNGVQGVWERMLPGLLGATTRRSRRETVDRVRGLVLSQSPQAVGRAIRRMKERADATPRLGELGVPALVLVGQEDEITSPDLVRQMHARMPGGDLVVLPRAGHLSNLEQSDAFNAALTAFLAAHP